MDPLHDRGFDYRMARKPVGDRQPGCENGTDNDGDTAYSSELQLPLARLRHVRGSETLRATSIQHAQKTIGNRAVQRQLGPAPTLSPEDAQIKKNIGDATSAVKLGKSVASQAGVAPRGYGVTVDAGSELLNRLASGQGGLEATGGAATKAGTSLLTSSDAWKEAVGSQSRTSSIGGILGSGLQLAGSLFGSQGLQDAGQYVSTGATLMSGPALASEGVQEGMTGLYDTGSSAIDWLRTGNTDKFIKQNDANIRGQHGSIIQGYSMMANLAAGNVSGDDIADASERGDLGALPKLGARLGGWAHDSAVPWLKKEGGAVADWVEGAASSAWDGAKRGENWLENKASDVYDWASDEAGAAADWASDEASSAWGAAEDAAGWVGEKASAVGGAIEDAAGEAYDAAGDAAGWAGDKISSAASAVWDWL